MVVALGEGVATKGTEGTLLFMSLMLKSSLTILMKSFRRKHSS